MVRSGLETLPMWSAKNAIRTHSQIPLTTRIFGTNYTRQSFMVKFGWEKIPMWSDKSAIRTPSKPSCHQSLWNKLHKKIFYGEFRMGKDSKVVR